MNVEIISVGTELLLGDIVNTNAQYISRELAAIGINVYRQMTLGDNIDRLVRSFEIAFERADTVITTGGLGPTGDDITKEAAAKYFGQEARIGYQRIISSRQCFQERQILYQIKMGQPPEPSLRRMERG